MFDHAVIDELSDYAHGRAISPAELNAEPGEVFGEPPFSTVLDAARSLRSRAELNELVAEVAPFIRAREPFRGSTVAITCGTLIEMGGDPGIVAPHLFAELPRHLALARRLRDRAKRKPSDEQTLFEEDSDGLQALRGLTYLLLPTMAVLCRGMEFRREARASREIVEGVNALRDANREADFVSVVLGYTDGVELLVLAPEEGRGFRVALEAVNNNFHLFTLLQGALVGDQLEGEPTDPEVLALARGEVPPQRLHKDYARRHFYTWAGLRPDGTFAATDFRTWIPGDAKPTDVPTFEGERVVVIGPPLLGSRSWDSNNFANIHDALRSRADVVEVLTADQTTAWLDRIRQARR